MKKILSLITCLALYGVTEASDVLLADLKMETDQEKRENEAVAFDQIADVNSETANLMRKYKKILFLT